MDSVVDVVVLTLATRIRLARLSGGGSVGAGDGDGLTACTGAGLVPGQDYQSDGGTDDGDPAAQQRRHVGTLDAKTDPAHDGKRHAGPDAHETGKVPEPEEQHGSNAKGRKDLTASQAEGKEPNRDGVVAEAVDVIGPEDDDAVRGPAVSLLPGGCKVLVVQVVLSAYTSGVSWDTGTVA